MKAFILAAGYGTRMRPLTDHRPKPLLPIAGKPMIQYHIERLQQSGISELVINTAYLGEQIENLLGDGSQFGVSIAYSHEGTPLETGGAIVHARDLLGTEPFLLVNGDIYTDYPFQALFQKSPEVAHLILVDTPAFKQTGDFGLAGDRLTSGAEKPYTYAGIGVYNPAAFTQYAAGESFALGPFLRQQSQLRRVTAEVFNGHWMDIGTPQRLQAIDAQIRNQNG